MHYTYAMWYKENNVLLGWLRTNYENLSASAIAPAGLSDLKVYNIQEFLGSTRNISPDSDDPKNKVSSDLLILASC
jgi:hypothetical protein